MKELHYGEGYVYAHDTEEKIARMQCLPDSFSDRRYYEPSDQGMERQVAERLSAIRAFREGGGNGPV